MPQVALSTFTNLDIYPGAVVENLGTLLTFNFELDEPARVGGLKIYVDSDTPGILGRLDLSALNDNPDFLSNLTVNQESFENFTGSGFVVTVEAGAKSASLTLPALDIADLNGLDLTTFTLTTREETDRTTQTDPVTGDQGSDLNTVEADGFPIGDYTVDPESASSRVLFADNVADLPPLPVVSFSTTPQVVNEAEGTFLVMDFSVEGEIPDGGVTVNLEGDAARIMEQFDVVQAGIDQETGNIFYRFDEDFVNSDNIVGGILDPFSLEDGDPAENNSDPEAAGDAFLSSFSFTITENTASIRLPVLDDFVQEDDATFTYSPALESAVESGYLVDPDVNSGTFTLTDGVEPATSPTIGVTVGSTTLIRDEQTVMELTFTSEGDIPAEGVVVLLEGPPKGFAEFDFSEPINITGGTIVGTDDIASTLSLLITDPTATVELPVLLEEEGQETIVLPFTLIDGEQYEIDPEASAIEVTIQDPPVISLGLLGGTFNGNDLIVPHLVEQADGIPILSVVLESDGTIPEGGLIVDVNTDLADITELVNEPQFNPIAFGGQVISAIYDEAGIATGLRVRMDDPNTVVNFQNGVGFDATGPQTVSFFVEEGDRYISTGEAASITVYDTLDQVPPPPEPLPEVGVTIAGGGISQQVPPLVEGEGDITLELTVEGEIPTDGVITYLKTDQEAGLGEFDLLNAEVVGGLFPSPDGDGEGFYFKVTEPTATITVQAAVDDIEEGIETIDFSLQSVPGYTIDDDAQGISLELADDENSKIQVSIDSSPIDLVAEEETLATITLNLSSPPPAIKPIPSRDGTPPEAGILITVQTDGLQEFNLDSLTATGGNIVNVNTDTGTIDIRALEQTVTITATVANDGEAEGLETVLFTLVEPGEDADYQISTTNPEQNQVSFDIYNTLNESPVRVESAESDDTIATSIPIAINSDRSSAIVTGEIDFNFGNNRDVDQTEDVDMYSVQLEAGDRLVVDLDSIASDDGEEVIPGHLRLFDAAGADLVDNNPGADLGEGLVSGGNTLIDFTADTAGTYYIGVSQTFNGNYDPNNKGTGDGALLDLGLGIGEYELKVDLNIEPPDNDSVVIEVPDIEPGDPNDTTTTNNDIIASATPLNFAPDNLSITVDAEIAERFQERDNAVDATEDVDFYSFNLEAGESITIDVDANGIGDAGLGSILDSILLIFEVDDDQMTDVTELARSNNDAAPDEIFQAEGDPFIVFTAPETGTYYAGISALGNDFYDPNLANSGSGWTFGERFGADIYRVNFSLDVPPLPVVSIEVTPPSVLEGGPDDTGTVAFTVDGEVPDVEFDGNGDYVSGGLSVFLDIQELDVLEVQFEDFVGNELIIGPFSDPTQPGVLEFILFDETASASFTAIDDDVPEPPIPFEFTLLEDLDGSDYLVDTDANSGSLTLIDDDPLLPTVSIEVDETELIEGDDVTFSFDALGGVDSLPSPNEPVTILVNGDTLGGLAEFELFDENNNPLFTTVGIESVSILDDETNFSAILIDPDASITFTVLDDGIPEGPQTFTYTLADDQTGYFVDPNAESVTITIADIPVPVVSIEVTPPSVLEGGPDDTGTITFNVDQEVPADGLSVFLDIEDFDVFEAQFDPLVPNDLIIQGTEAGVLELILFEETATASFTAIDDDVPEPPIPFEFTLLEDLVGSDYLVDPDANSGSLTLVDDDGRPTVSIEVDETELIEGDDVTFSFDALGGVDLLPSPNEPVTILVNGDTLGGLAEFELFDENNNPLFTTVGIESVSILDDETNFSAVLIDPDASITFSVVDDGLNEAEEQFTYTLADEQPDYFVDPNAESVTITIEGVDGIFFGTPGRDIFDAGLTPPGFDGVNNTVFAREGDDLIDTVGGSGGNTLYGEQDNDTFILGGDDTAFGGQGNDRFFLLGGNNIITGDSGADQFWIAVAEIPESSNTINDFNSVEEDKIGIAGLRIGFDDLTLTADGNDTLIILGNDQLARLIDIDPNSLTEADFIFLDDDPLLPTVSIEVTPPSVLEGGPDDTGTITFNVDQEVPAEGLSVFLDIEDFDVFEAQFDPLVPNDLIIQGTEAGVLELILFEETATASFTAIDDDVPEAPIPFEFTLLEDLVGSDYAVDLDANSGSLTLVDDDFDLPTVSIEVDNTDLIEGDDITFSLDALGGVDIVPSDDNPVTILVNGDTVGGLAEFELFDENNNPLFTTVGIESVSILDDETNFSAVLIDPNASITFSVLDDGIEEGLEQFTYTLADGQADYVVDPNAESVTITIDDPIIGGPGADIFDAGLTPGFDGVNDTVFAREGDDLIDTNGGSGGNTLYGEENNDTFILRSNDTAFGGEGEDSFFLLRGDNIITGGPGADEFWLVASDIPESVNIINDFNDIDGDVLGIASLDFDQLTISDANGDTLIAAGGNPFARLIGVDANSLSEDNFIIV